MIYQQTASFLHFHYWLQFENLWQYLYFDGWESCHLHLYLL
jgi:hypothetical protein